MPGRQLKGKYPSVGKWGIITIVRANRVLHLIAEAWQNLKEWGAAGNAKRLDHSDRPERKSLLLAGIIRLL